MEHECGDKNSDYICDACGCGMAHECQDRNCDDWCDLCGQYLSDETAEISLSVNSYLDGDVSGSISFSNPVLGTGDTFSGNNFSDSWSLTPGTYTWTAIKYCHVMRSGTVTVMPGVQMALNITLCPIGDATGDGRVNAGDTAKVFAHVREAAMITDEYEAACADVTGDGQLNMGDVARIFAHVRETNTLW